jgi:hypothetical protein
MIALAASWKRPAAARTSIPITPSNACAFNGSPITPVDARNTSAGLQPAASLASFAVSTTASRPVLPVVLARLS